VRKVKTEMPAVLTIGHSTRTWKDFLDLVRSYRVKRVIDVRSIPRSRHNPQFNQETLSTKLRAARIGYVLATPSSPDLLRRLDCRRRRRSLLIHRAEFLPELHQLPELLKARGCGDSRPCGNGCDRLFASSVTACGAGP